MSIIEYLSSAEMSTRLWKSNLHCKYYIELNWIESNSIPQKVIATVHASITYYFLLISPINKCWRIWFALPCATRKNSYSRCHKAYFCLSKAKCGAGFTSCALPSIVCSWNTAWRRKMSSENDYDLSTITPVTIKCTRWWKSPKSGCYSPEETHSIWCLER